MIAPGFEPGTVCRRQMLYPAELGQLGRKNRKILDILTSYFLCLGIKFYLIISYNIFIGIFFCGFHLLFIHCKSQNIPINLQQIAHVPASSFQVPSDLCDIWGWVDDQGNEYAIVGTNEGTSIFDLSNPAAPTEIFFEQGMNSIWRDVKTFGDYAYVTTEAQNGLLIIDLSPLPDSNNLTTYYYTGPSNAPWQKAHNLFIDDRGYAYIFGANRGVKGCIILDLNQDPTQPVEVADINNWYVHDGMVKGDTLYLANVSDGFTIWDVSVPSNPVMIGQHGTLGAFAIMFGFQMMEIIYY